MKTFDFLCVTNFDLSQMEGKWINNRNLNFIISVWAVVFTRPASKVTLLYHCSEVYYLRWPEFAWMWIIVPRSQNFGLYHSGFFWWHKFQLCTRSEGTGVAQWLRCCATNRKVAGSIPAGVSGIFYWHKILPIALGRGVDSASNTNECQEHFLGVRVAGAWGWRPYHYPVPLSWNVGTLSSWNTLGL